MEGRSYVSCIKINGVPILPPMMTKDVREATARYKKWAVAVEKKLEASRVANRPKTTSLVEEVYQKTERVDDDPVATSLESGPFDSSPNVTTAIHLRESDAEGVATGDASLQSSDGEYDSESRSCLVPSTVSRSESTATTKSATVETTPEIWKPQVPKTLDVVPMTLNDPSYGEDEKCSEDESRDTRSTPKLVRQGSYVLDTPSPMLLARMETELAADPCVSSFEYVPTRTTNAVRRKEWNFARAKIEWQQQAEQDEIVPREKDNAKNPCSCPRSADRRLCKSVCSRVKSEPPLGAFPSTRSVDCIQAMLAKEYIGRNNLKNNETITANGTGEKAHECQKWRRYDNRSVLNPAHGLGGSLGNLKNAGAAFFHPMENEPDNKISMNGERPEEEPAKEHLESNVGPKSSVTSEKLLTVYKEIQRMHRMQMAELVTRQRKEQTLLQQEFEKQQLLLLTEIRKSFPEISVALLSSSENTQTAIANDRVAKTVPRSNGTRWRESRSSAIDLEQESATESTCPLDYVYSEIQGHEETSVQRTQSTQTLNGVSAVRSGRAAVANEGNGCDPSTNPTTEPELAETDPTLKENGERKRLSVSRQLFPLDSKTVHVPVLESANSESKRIRAANVINAYARGYLTRRLMQTERVIALKNTYREAIHCMMKLHVDAPLNRPEINFYERLRLQCDGASWNIVELFVQSPRKRMQIIAQDRNIRRSRIERPTSARSYSFATQRTLARKKLKEMGDYRPPSVTRSCTSRSRCQTWTSDVKEKLISPNVLNQSIKRSTSAGTVRKPWR